MMNDFRQHVYFVLATVLVTAVATYLLGGTLVMLVSLDALLFAWLIGYWVHLGKLAQWLESPKLRNVPTGIGIWEHVFKTLMQQAKSRKKRKQKLGMALQRFNNAAEAMPNGVVILGKDGRVQWLNTLAAKHLHLDITIDANGILPNLIRAPEFHHLLGIPLTEPVSIKLAMSDQSGLPQTLNVIRAPFEDQADLLITQDITAAEQLNVMRTAFVANVSHELRTPLTVINGFLETMADMPDLPQAQQQQFITLMRKEGERMHQLLADLLTLSRLESHESEAVHHEPLCLSALVRQLLQEAQSLSKQQHEWHSDIADDVWVEGVQLDLYNALSNLVFNAVRYTQAGGHITVSLSGNLEMQSPQAIFSVRDTGPGIAPEHIPHLTERFYRVDPSRSRQSGGTGLGLAITKHALAEHKGVLRIESEVGVGSVFTALLPQIPPPIDEGVLEARPPASVLS